MIRPPDFSDLVAVVGALLLPASVLSQEELSGPERHGAIEEGVRAVENRRFEAMMAVDLAALDSILADEVIYTTPVVAWRPGRSSCPDSHRGISRTKRSSPTT